MREPSPRTSRLAIAASLAAIVIVGGAGFLFGRSTVPALTPATPPAAAPAPALPEKPEPTTENTLGRSDLIALGNASAQAAADRAALPGDMLERVGRRFELLLPFGCDGPAAANSEAPLRWRYDTAASALRIHVAPVTWVPGDWWPDPSAPIEAMEGFWIERPWSSRETCSSPAADALTPGIEPVTLPGQTLAIVQLISRDTPRQIRRDGKPYEAVVRLAPDPVDRDRGLRIRVAGRIGRFPDGQPVRCRQPGGREQRPICLVAVTTEEVAIENPATGETLAEWQPTLDVPASSDPIAR